MRAAFSMLTLAIYSQNALLRLIMCLVSNYFCFAQFKLSCVAVIILQLPFGSSRLRLLLRSALLQMRLC